MPMTEYGDISPRVGVYAEAKMLTHAQPILVLEKFASVRPMPGNKGQTIKFRRPVPLLPATTPLVEGVTPASQAFSYEDVTATLSQIGAWSETTDVVADTHEDPVLNDMMTMSGEQAAETRETLNWGVIKGGTNVLYANGTARNQVNTPISLNKVRAVTRALNRQRARKITKIQDGSVKIGTKPVEAAYVAFCHTDCEADIRAIPGFKSVAEYGTRQPLCEHELGSVESIRFIVSPVLTSWVNAGGAKGTMLSTGGTSADVYPIIVIGQEAFGTVPLKGKGSVVPMVLNPNTPRGGDPMGQRGSVAWKSWFCTVILSQVWMARLEVAVTEL